MLSAVMAWTIFFISRHCIIYILSSALMTRSNIARYLINNYMNWGKISIRYWIKKDTQYFALTGELWGVFCEFKWEHWLRYNGTALYLCLCFLNHVNTKLHAQWCVHFKKNIYAYLTKIKAVIKRPWFSVIDILQWIINIIYLAVSHSIYFLFIKKMPMDKVDRTEFGVKQLIEPDGS